MNKTDKRYYWQCNNFARKARRFFRRSPKSQAKRTGMSFAEYKVWQQAIDNQLKALNDEMDKKSGVSPLPQLSALPKTVSEAFA